MCTASWVSTADGYTLFFNRDEQRSRAPGRPPREVTRAGVRVLAPEDAEAGGTWIGVNAHGVTVCLLNREALRRPAIGSRAPTRPISRGILVASLLDAGSTGEVASRIGAMTLGAYKPFTVAAIEPGRPVILLGWDGHDVTRSMVDRPGLIATSSSLDGEAARLSRCRLFNGLARVGHAELQQLHRSHLPVAGPTSICMHRSDAETVSACRIDVTSAGAEVEYTPGAPCRAAPPVTHRLSRSEAGVTA